jgi:hypothetical protein
MVHTFRLKYQAAGTAGGGIFTMALQFLRCGAKK